MESTSAKQGGGKAMYPDPYEEKTDKDQDIFKMVKIPRLVGKDALTS